MGSTTDVTGLLSYIAFTCWHIWKAWCDFIFNQNTILPRQVFLFLTSSVRFFLEASHSQSGNSFPSQVSSSALVKWSPLSSHFMKVNVDASWSASNCEGIVGVVVWNAEAWFMAAGKWQTHAPSAKAAEANVIFVGCEFAKSMDLQQIVVESDSKENISCLLNDISFGSWEVFPTLTRILRLRDVFQRCRWS